MLQRSGNGGDNSAATTDSLLAVARRQLEQAHLQVFFHVLLDVICSLLIEEI
jgi:hypothetical protein